ncbi:MAG: DNA-formamidopyrimidine glycosylase family protein [Candidatus Thorarchaeota archaeon]
MSNEMPEARILALQMSRELVGKKIESWNLTDTEKLQKSGMVGRNLDSFDGFVGGSIESVQSRGNIIRIKLESGMNLLLAPEYGGTLLYHEDISQLPKKTHLTLTLVDKSALTVRLKGWGHIYACEDSQLEKSYVYSRDFSETMAPDEKTFTFERFNKLVTQSTKNVKTMLVGRDAILVGLSNSSFQDIIFRARLHPKRKSSDLTVKEVKELFDAIKTVVRDRLRLGGKNQFVDLYGTQGSYLPAMGPNMKGLSCPRCDGAIQRIAHGGGHVYLCPSCQE